MGTSYASLHVHLVFGTKNREPWIRAEIQPSIWSYIGGIAKDRGMVPVRIGGVDDHVHALVGMPATISVSWAVQVLKGASSHWIHQTFPDLSRSGWQDGYGAFSVSVSSLDRVSAYIENQRTHHQGRSYEEEMEALLKRHSISPLAGQGLLP